MEVGKSAVNSDKGVPTQAHEEVKAVPLNKP